MRHKITRLALAVFMGTALLAAGGARAADYTPPMQVISIGSHASGSMYIVFLAGWSKVITENMPGLNVNVEGGGPTKNIVTVSSGETQFGMTTDIHAYLGMTGEIWTMGKKYPDIRGLFPAYPAILAVWTLEGNKVKTFPEGLNDAVIAAGAKGSLTDIFLKQVIETFQLKPRRVSYSNWSDTTGTIGDGLADVGVNIGGHPAGFIQDLEARHSLNIIPMSPDARQTFLAKYPYYSTATLKPVYKGMKGEEYPDSIASCNFVFTSKDLDEEFVYQLVKLTWENAERVRSISPELFSYMQMENIRYIPIPLHKGAIRYYREKGVPLLPVHTQESL